MTRPIVLGSDTKADFTSTLLIASKKLADGGFMFLNPEKNTCPATNRKDRTIVLPNCQHGLDHVNVIAFDCDDKKSIAGVVMGLCNLLKTKPQTENLKNSINYLEKTLQSIAGPYEHDVPQNLLDEVQRFWGREITADKVIYLSSLLRTY